MDKHIHELNFKVLFEYLSIPVYSVKSHTMWSPTSLRQVLLWDLGFDWIDAFNIKWSNENNVLVSPIGLIIKVIKHAIACECVCTLVVPKWESAVFWHVLFPQNKERECFVKNICNI